MSEPTIPEKPYIAPGRDIRAWAIGGITTNALICLYGQAMNFFTVGFGWSAALVGTAMAFPRIIDALIDPFMGQLSDKTNTRWGRRKPFLVIGSVLASLFIFGLWWGDSSWSKNGQVAYLAVVGTLFYVSWGVYAMAWTALGYELTDDYNERSRISAFAGYFTSAVLLLNAWTYWFALRPLFHNGVIATVKDLFSRGIDFPHMGLVLSNAFRTVQGAPVNEVNGIRWIATGVVIVALAAAFYTTRNCKERFKDAGKVNHTPILKALAETFKNRPFVILMLYKLFQLFGERVFQGLLFYIGIYYIFGGDKNAAGALTGSAGIYACILGFCMLPLIRPISVKLGKRAGLIIPSLVALVLLICQPFLLTPSHPYLLLIPLLVLAPLSVISATMMNAIVPDICDLDELEHGERREGLFTSVTAFMNKLEISLSVLIVGYLVNFSGVDPKTTIQQPEVLQKLLWFAIGPGIFFAGGAFVTACCFKLNEESMNGVRRALEDRRAAKALAVKPVETT
ncbi:MAG: MFS transporter [Luteolibacter sp.]|uniref:MFS transporter n=1 Tax=Luteolibacter sp. TaxID=1962973 RepID=UPI00326667AE